MAQKVKIIVTDDLDGQGDAENHQLGLDGEFYSIDLNEDNFTKLNQALEPFISQGRKLRASEIRKTRSGRKAAKNSRNAAVRTWAQNNGHDIGDRGRIPADIHAAYEAAQQDDQQHAQAS